MKTNNQPEIHQKFLQSGVLRFLIVNINLLGNIRNNILIVMLPSVLWDVLGR